MNTNVKKLPLLGASLLVSGLSMQANAQLVYEGFDYTAGDPIVGSGTAADGWAGAWSGSDNNTVGTPETTADGLTFGTLPVVGGAYSRPARNGVAESSRLLSASAQTALTEDNTTTWFSVLLNVRNDAAGLGFATNSNGAIIFGDTSFGLADPATDSPANGGNGFGVSFFGPDGIFDNATIRGVSYVGGTRTSTALQSVTIGTATVMIVGQIDWAANGTADTVSLYNVIDPAAGLPAAFATFAADLDQSAFDRVAIAQGQVEVFDEIRFDTTLAGVGVGGSAAPGELDITAFGFDPDLDEVALTWNSVAGVTYNVMYSSDLIDWTNTVGTVTGASGTSTSSVFNLTSSGVPSSARLFFRVEEE